MGDGPRMQAWERAFLAVGEWERTRPRWVRRLYILAFPIALPLHIVLIIGPMAMWLAWAGVADAVESAWTRP